MLVIDLYGDIMLDPLLIDLYPFDLAGEPNLNRLVAAGYPWCGVWLKTSQGLYYPNPHGSKGYDGKWFRQYFPLAKTLAGDRYGVDWFRSCYHYADLKQDPIKQASFFLSLVDDAGGWGKGDLPPFLDMEQGGNPTGPGEKTIDEWIHAYSVELKKLHGRAPICYGGSYLRDNLVNEISDDCPYLVVANYDNILEPALYTKIGYTYGGSGPGSLFGWQYRGTDDPGQPKQTLFPKGYPSMTPLSATTAVDITAVTIAGGGQNALAAMRTMCFQPPSGSCS